MRRPILYPVLLLCAVSLGSAGQGTLPDYLLSAIKNSPVFADNKNQVLSLGLDSMLIRAGLRPQVNFTSTNVYAPVVNGYGYDEIITNQGSYNALLGVNLAIVGKNNLNNQYSSRAIQKQIVELNSKLSERDLKQTVTAQYITVYSEQRLLSNGEKVLDVLRKEDQILKNNTEKGQYRQTDYLSFLVSFKQQQLSFSRAQMQMQSDSYLLKYLCGITDTSIVDLADPGLSVSQSLAMEQTSPYRQFLLDSLQLQNAMDQVKFRYKPRLNVLGDAGYFTSFLYHAEKNFGASVGLNLSVPIYDGNQRSIQLDKYKLSGDTRLHHMDFYKRQYSIRQTQYQQQIRETEKLIASAEEQLRLAETLLLANNQLLETGDAKISDYILSLTNYISSQVAVQQFNADKLQLVNQLNYLNY